MSISISKQKPNDLVAKIENATDVNNELKIEKKKSGQAFHLARERIFR